MADKRIIDLLAAGAVDTGAFLAVDGPAGGDPTKKLAISQLIAAITDDLGLGGDVSGAIGATTVDALQSVPLSMVPAVDGFVLTVVDNRGTKIVRPLPLPLSLPLAVVDGRVYVQNATASNRWEWVDQPTTPAEASLTTTVILGDRTLGVKFLVLEECAVVGVRARITNAVARSYLVQLIRDSDDVVLGSQTFSVASPETNALLDFTFTAEIEIAGADVGADLILSIYEDSGTEYLTCSGVNYYGIDSSLAPGMPVVVGTKNFRWRQLNLYGSGNAKPTVEMLESPIALGPVLGKVAQLPPWT